MSEDATMNAAELALAKFILGPWVRLFNDMRATLISPPPANRFVLGCASTRRSLLPGKQNAEISTET